jgi:hypothetical protein
VSGMCRCVARVCVVHVCLDDTVRACVCRETEADAVKLIPSSKAKTADEEGGDNELPTDNQSTNAIACCRAHDYAYADTTPPASAAARERRGRSRTEMPAPGGE